MTRITEQLARLRARIEAAALAAGRDPAIAPTELWSEAILEIEPDGASGGNVVWSWRVWDNLIQNHDPKLPNYGQPADYPGRIDINFSPNGAAQDWLHFNAIEYNPDLDQIIVSSRNWHEVWVLRHAPNRSGELIYRYGNPEAYTCVRPT